MGIDYTKASDLFNTISEVKITPDIFKLLLLKYSSEEQLSIEQAFYEVMVFNGLYDWYSGEHYG